MKLTTKGRYAVTAMLDLALHQGAGPVALADIAQRQHISLSYLEQLFAKLRGRDLVVSTRGPGGGYRLSRAADKLVVAEIIVAVDECVEAARCRETGDCPQEARCLTHDLWSALSDQISGFLERISLGSLMATRGVQEVAARQDRLACGDANIGNAEQFVALETRV